MPIRMSALTTNISEKSIASTRKLIYPGYLLSGVMIKHEIIASSPDAIRMVSFFSKLIAFSFI